MGQLNRETYVIHAEEENEHYHAALNASHSSGDPMPKEELSTQRVHSRVLRGAWDLSNTHIQELAERFNVSTELSSPQAQKNA